MAADFNIWVCHTAPQASGFEAFGHFRDSFFSQGVKSIRILSSLHVVVGVHPINRKCLVIKTHLTGATL